MSILGIVHKIHLTRGSIIVIKVYRGSTVTAVMYWTQLCCNFNACYKKKYENPWTGFQLTLSGGVLDLNAITTTELDLVIYYCFKNKPYSTSP